MQKGQHILFQGLTEVCESINTLKTRVENSAFINTILGRTKEGKTLGGITRDVTYHEAIVSDIRFQISDSLESEREGSSGLPNKYVGLSAVATPFSALFMTILSVCCFLYFAWEEQTCWGQPFGYCVVIHLSDWLPNMKQLPTPQASIIVEKANI